jgi:hypothetical protein
MIRRLLALGFALVLTGLLAHSAAALTDQAVDNYVHDQGLLCGDGTYTTHFEFNADGSVNSVTVTCVGSSLGDFDCSMTWAGTFCAEVLPLPPAQTPRESTLPPAGAIGGGLEQVDYSRPARGVLAPVDAEVNAPVTQP